MPYREGVSQLQVLRDAYVEALEHEARATVAKQQAELELLQTEAALEVAWANHGAQAALERHYEAIAAAQRTARREISEIERAALAEVEAERVRFLRERGVEPGPAPADAASVAPEAIDPAAEGARAKAREIRASIQLIETELTAARERLAAAAEELMRASRAVRAAAAALSAVGGLDEQ